MWEECWGVGTCRDRLLIDYISPFFHILMAQRYINFCCNYWVVNDIRIGEDIIYIVKIMLLRKELTVMILKLTKKKTMNKRIL